MKYQKIACDSIIETIVDPDAHIEMALIEAEALRKEHSLNYVDVNYKGFTMSVDGETCLAQLSIECFSWIKKNEVCPDCGYGSSVKERGGIVLGACNTCGCFHFYDKTCVPETK